MFSCEIRFEPSLPCSVIVLVETVFGLFSGLETWAVE
jgi:hypothetical protein